MGGDAVCARHVPDQGDRLQNAFRCGERRVRRLRRVLHRHSIATRRTVPPLAVVVLSPAHVPNRFETERITIASRIENGWVTERSIVHAWKACVPKGTGGSNPPPSAVHLMLLIVSEGADHSATAKATQKMRNGALIDSCVLMDTFLEFRTNHNHARKQLGQLSGSGLVIS